MALYLKFCLQIFLILIFIILKIIRLFQNNVSKDLSIYLKYIHEFVCLWLCCTKILVSQVILHKIKLCLNLSEYFLNMNIFWR